jgi:hypothetical protein
MINLLEGSDERRDDNHKQASRRLSCFIDAF